MTKTLTAKQKKDLDYARRIRNENRRRFNRILKKEGPLQHRDVHSFFRGLPKSAKDTAGVLFIYRLEGMTAREIADYLLPDNEDL